MKFIYLEESEAMYFPIYVKLESENCIVVGGGIVALRKVSDLLAYKAKITVISPKIVVELDELEEVGMIEVKRRTFRRSDLDGAALVTAATDNRRVNHEVADECRRRGVLCNVVDQPDLCTAIFPAVLQRGRLSISVSTGGASPAMARRIKEELGKLFGGEYVVALDILAELRKEIMKKNLNENKRKDIFTKLVYSNLLQLCKNKDHTRIDELIRHVIGEDISLRELGISFK